MASTTFPKISGPEAAAHASPTREDRDVEEGKEAATGAKMSLMGGISVIVSLMVGSGIFTSVCDIQGALGSPRAALLMWAVTGALTLAGALCYAELGTMIPGSGGEAQYIARSPIAPAFLAAMFEYTLIFIVKPATIAILGIATARQVVLLKKNIVSFVPAESYKIDENSAASLRVVALIFCILVTALPIASTRWSDRIQNGLTASKVVALGVIILGGIYTFVVAPAATATDSLGGPIVSYLQENMAVPLGTGITNFSLIGGFTGAAYHGLFSYDGWNNLNLVAGNLDRPHVNLPLGILTAVLFVAVVYVLTNLAYYAVLRANIIGNSENVVAVAFGQALLGRAGCILVPGLVVLSCFSAALSSMLTAPDVIILAAQRGRLPRLFAHTSPHLGTALWAYLMQCAIACPMVLLFSYNNLVSFSTFPLWLFFAACVVILVYLRFAEPHAPRPYKVYLFTPFAFLLACAIFLTISMVTEWAIFSATIAAILLPTIMWYVHARWSTPKGTTDKEEEAGDAAEKHLSPEEH